MKISSNLAIAMINSDISELSENEIDLIKDFPDFTIVDYCDDSRDLNGVCKITKLWAHCVEIETK